MTPMFAVMVLPPFSFAGEQDQAMDDDGAMLREITSLPDDIDKALPMAARTTWRLDYSWTAGINYWMNHCTHCRAKQGDHFVHGPDGPFWPNDDAGMEALTAARIEGHFRFLGANISYSGAMADWRDRHHGVSPVASQKSRQESQERD